MNKKTQIKLIFGLFVSVFCMRTYASEINFDSGINNPFSALTEAQEISKLTPSMSRDLTWRYEPCEVTKTLEFYRENGAIVNKMDSLYTNYIETNCNTYTPQPGGNPYEQCQDNKSYAELNFSLFIDNRELFEDEMETVEVYYNFCRANKPNIEINSPYEYSIKTKKIGDYNYAFELKPIRRIPKTPSAEMFSLKSFGYDPVEGVFIMEIRGDIPYRYSGYKAVFHGELIKDKFFSDETKDIKNEEGILYSGNNNFKITFKPSGKGKYYINWGFKIIGELFNENYVGKGKSQKIEI
ncbi:MAG: hypothetical protein GX447_00860 [Elusimicrobia bacterium]|nr:hypothetical protein [Elusimicrobiota bacterium]